jgi:hypothetical protein
MQAGREGFGASVQQSAQMQAVEQQQRLQQMRQDVYARHPGQPNEAPEDTKRRLLAMAMELAQAGDGEGSQEIMKLVSSGAFATPESEKPQIHFQEGPDGTYKIVSDAATGKTISVEKVTGPKPVNPSASLTLADKDVNQDIKEWTGETKDAQASFNTYYRGVNELVHGGAINAVMVYGALGQLAAPNNAREVTLLTNIILHSEGQGVFAKITQGAITNQEKIDKITNYLMTRYGNTLPQSIKLELADGFDSLVQDHAEKLQRMEKIMRRRASHRQQDPDEIMGLLDNPANSPVTLANGLQYPSWQRGLARQAVLQQSPSPVSPVPSF